MIRGLFLGAAIVMWEPWPIIGAVILAVVLTVLGAMFDKVFGE